MCTRTLRASRVIGWYSDTKKLSFAFIPASNRGDDDLSEIKRALSPLRRYVFHIRKRIFANLPRCICPSPLSLKNPTEKRVPYLQLPTPFLR